MVSPHLKASAFLPRSESKFVFVLAMASYTLASAGVVSAIATAIGARHAPLGVFLKHGYPGLEVLDLLVFAPIIESLILIGMIELLIWLRSPMWLQLFLPAAIVAGLHTPVAHALVVTPGWFIMTAAYLMWRRVSWKVGFAVIAPIHALLNLDSAIVTISYAIHHAKA